MSESVFTGVGARSRSDRTTMTRGERPVGTDAAVNSSLRNDDMTSPIGRRDFLRTTAAVTAAAMTGLVPLHSPTRRSRSSRRP